jgi:hypothetical protein
MRRILYVDDGSPVRRLHMPDIGVVAVQHDLAAAGDIDPGNLANTGTMTHGVFPFGRNANLLVSAQWQLLEEPTLAGERRVDLHGLHHRPQRGLIGGDHRLAERALPAGDKIHGREVAAWERQFGKPVITTNQAALWAVLQTMKVETPLAGKGRLLEQLPSG